MLITLVSLVLLVEAAVNFWHGHYELGFLCLIYIEAINISAKLSERK